MPNLREADSLDVRDRTRERGVTLIELAIGLAITATISIGVGQFFVQSSNALNTMAVKSNMTGRGQAVMDRMLADLTTARFVSMTPAVPDRSNWIRFQRPTGFSGGAATYGNPIQIELIPTGDVDWATVWEDWYTDGTPPDPGSVVQLAMQSIRIWEDFPPHGSTPGTEDTSTLIARNLAPEGLLFTRNGASIEVQLTFIAIGSDAKKGLETFTIVSGVKMRNTE